MRHNNNYLQYIKRCNNADLSDFVPWSISNEVVGYISKDTASKLLTFDQIFYERDKSLHLSEVLNTPSRRTKAVAKLLDTLRAESLGGEKLHENYAVRKRIGHPTLMNIDRGASTYFGIISTGFHLNGFVIHGNQIKMWVATRSLDRATFPGQLDNVVAGGQPSNLTIAENVIKECNEEASIPAWLAVEALSTGLISYRMRSSGGLRRHVMYTYDLVMPVDFIPKPNDGEVENFSLVNIEDIEEILQKSPNAFKFNCNLVVIDFLIRHGLIHSEDPVYFEIINGLRSPLD
ncbi:DUF4743 domain-containing protein [Alphaproteobacteria bacterium]|nr:DUF4743 domain-containing protein [Alphaproteobacteria bacterium]